MKALLKIKNLQHRFGGLKALTDFETTLADSGIYGLIGPNGAGKTTVFNIVSGFYQPTEGSLLFNDVELNQLSPHRINALGIGRTFQNIRLWSELTVLENLLLAQHGQLQYGLWACLLRTRKFLQREKALVAWSYELLEKFKLQSLAEQPIKTLAYGMQRRIEIIRALATRPQLLLLDEPAAGLNAQDASQLMEMIRTMEQQFKIAIWMVEHQMKIVMSLCTHITVLDFGRIIATGSPKEIQQNPVVIKAYLGQEQPDAA